MLRKEASNKQRKEMEVAVSSRNIFEIAKQAMKDRKEATGKGCVWDKCGKLRMHERDIAQWRKDHMERAMNEDNDWDRNVEVDATEVET